MTGVRLSKNAIRVIGSKPISKICLKTFRRGVRIKGGDLLKIISFFVKLCYDIQEKFVFGDKT